MNWRFCFTIHHKRAKVSCKVTVIGSTFNDAILKVDRAWRLIPGIPDSNFTLILDRVEEVA